MQQGDSVQEILVGYLCFSLAMLMFLVCCLSSCIIIPRCCACLPFLNFVTFAIAIILLSAGALKNAIGEAADNMCNDYAEEIEEFFNRVVDKPMCSDMCPCDDDASTSGGYDSISALDLLY